MLLGGVGVLALFLWVIALASIIFPDKPNHTRKEAIEGAAREDIAREIAEYVKADFGDPEYGAFWHENIKRIAVIGDTAKVYTNIPKNSIGADGTCMEVSSVAFSNYSRVVKKVYVLSSNGEVLVVRDSYKSNRCEEVK